MTSKDVYVQVAQFNACFGLDENYPTGRVNAEWTKYLLSMSLDLFK